MSSYIGILCFWLWIFVIKGVICEDSPVFDPELQTKIKNGNTGPFKIVGHMKDKDSQKKIKEMFLYLLEKPEPHPKVAQCFGWEPISPRNYKTESSVFCEQCFIVDALSLDGIKDLQSKFPAAIDQIYEVPTLEAAITSAACYFKYGEGTSKSEADFIHYDLKGMPLGSKH